MGALHEVGGAFELHPIRRVDDDRAVTGVSIGPLHLESIWLLGLASGKPKISWPRTTRGYPIINVDQPLRGKIEQSILMALRNDS